MIGRGLNTLLIALVLVCPLLCGQGVCACGGHCASQADDHCGTCGSSCEHERVPCSSSNAPSDPSDAPCDDCQCFCGGAILAGSGELGFALLATPTMNSPMPPTGVHDSLVAQRTQLESPASRVQSPELRTALRRIQIDASAAEDPESRAALRD